MPGWLHPGLLVTVTTPLGEHYIWFDDRLNCARRLDGATHARIMRLQRARSLVIVGLGGFFFGALVLALLVVDTIEPLLFLLAFMATAALVSVWFARAQRRHLDRQPQINLPPEAVARLQAARAGGPFRQKQQQDVACKVAAELVYRTQ